MDVSSFASPALHARRVRGEDGASSSRTDACGSASPITFSRLQIAFARGLSDNTKEMMATIVIPSAWRLGLAVAMAVSAAAGATAFEINDYPTATRADYIFACMKANGDTRRALEQCSCSIDVIASILPYDHYVAAETVLSLSQVPGRFGAMFQSPEQARAAINDLRRAQAEAEVRCF